MTIRQLLILLSISSLGTAGAAWGSEKVLGAPSYDHATETTYRAVSWDDFQGKGVRPPNWNRWQGGSFAHIATALRTVLKYQHQDRQEGEEWVSQAIGLRPYAVMVKDFSAVQHGSRDDYTLAHEQLHFDLTEAYARRLAVELAAIEGRGPTFEDAREDLEQRLEAHLESGEEKLWEHQAQYDGETDNGQRKKQQKKWAKQIGKLLGDATTELAALLESSPENP